MKRIMLTICIIFTVSFAFAQERENLFTVSADAIVRVKPDKVVLNIGIIAKGKNLLETKKTVSAAITKSIAYCKQQGIPEKNIGTNYVNIRPVYDDYRSITELYYHIDQNISIILEDISKYDNILTQLLSFGMNQVLSVDFQVTELKKYRNEARRLAIRAAKERAEFLAAEAGIKLGEIRNINDQSSSWHPYWMRGNSMANTSQNMQQSGGGESGSDDNGAFAPGMISVRADITLIYEIKNR